MNNKILAIITTTTVNVASRLKQIKEMKMNSSETLDQIALVLMRKCSLENERIEAEALTKLAIELSPFLEVEVVKTLITSCTYENQTEVMKAVLQAFLGSVPLDVVNEIIKRCNNNYSQVAIAENILNRCNRETLFEVSIALLGTCALENEQSIQELIYKNCPDSEAERLSLELASVLMYKRQQ